MRTDQLPIHGNPEIMGGTPDFETLAAPDFDPRQVHASVIDFHFRLPGRRGLCVKVVFPLPNGNAIVLMQPEAHPDGSFPVVSAGRRYRQVTAD